MSDPKRPPKSVTGLKAFGRSALFAFLALAFLGLAVSAMILGGPLTVIVPYFVCFGIMLLMARKVFPRKVAPNVGPPDQPRSTARSGNPAVRSQDSAGTRQHKPKR